MKKALPIIIGFVLFFVLHFGFSLLVRGTDDIAKEIAQSLFVDVIWHILSYFVWPWIRKKMSRVK